MGEDPIGFASGDTNFYGYVGNSPINWIDSLGLTATCPASPPVNKKGWKPYVGNPWFFHCGYDTYLEDRIPTPDDPIVECVYDDDKKPVDDNHKYPGCKGTPDQYPATKPWDHTWKDSGGIWSCGWDAFKDSRRKDWDDIKKLWK